MTMTIGTEFREIHKLIEDSTYWALLIHVMKRIPASWKASGYLPSSIESRRPGNGINMH